MKTANRKKIKRMVNLFEQNTESMMILFGALTVFSALLPIRMDIQLLLGGFGFYLVIAGVIAKCIPLKN
jgi:hypothetical protein